jgi:hypothetical protein
MVWAKIDDEILDNPKISRAGPLGFALHVAAITWCCRNLTDGYIPYSRVNCLLDFTPPSMSVHDTKSEESIYQGADPIEIAEWLVECGLWHEEPGGFRLNDFLNYNPSKAKVLAERERARAKKPGGSDPPKAKPRQGLAGSSAEPPPKIRESSDGPVPVPVPVPFEPPNGGSQARARGDESESRIRSSGPAVTLQPDAPLTDDARVAWDTATMTAKPPDRPIEAVWVAFCGQFAGTEFPSRVKLIGRWQRWVGDECGYSEKRRIKAQENARKYADHTPKYEKPTAGQTSKFQAELARRLAEEAKKGAA